VRLEVRAGDGRRAASRAPMPDAPARRGRHLQAPPCRRGHTPGQRPRFSAARAWAQASMTRPPLHFSHTIWQEVDSHGTG